MPEHQVLTISNKEETKETTLREAGGVIKRTIGAGDVFEVNTRFVARLKRIAINTMQKKES